MILKKLYSKIMGKDFNLERFVKAQECPYSGYTTALKEMQSGGKKSHWIWYVFPQIKGLGHSGMTAKYAIDSYDEALEYLTHPVLGPRLREITNVVLSYPEGSDPNKFMMAPIDAMKLKSSMTLFDMVSPDDIYSEVLKKFFHGHKCQYTVMALSQE